MLWFSLGGAIGAVVLDQLTKWLFAAHTQPLNYGIAFGLGNGFSWELVSILILLVVGFSWWKSSSFWQQWALSIVFGAGVSNLYDRLLYGGVRDFICYPLVNVCGNVADILLVLAALSLVFVSNQGETTNEN